MACPRRNIGVLSAKIIVRPARPLATRTRSKSRLQKKELQAICFLEFPEPVVGLIIKLLFGRLDSGHRPFGLI